MATPQTVKRVIPLGGSTKKICEILSGKMHNITDKGRKLADATLIEMNFANLLQTEQQIAPLKNLQRVNDLIHHLDGFDNDGSRQSVAYFKQEAAEASARLREYEEAQKKYAEDAKKLNEQKNALLDAKNNPPTADTIDKLKREGQRLSDTKEALETSRETLMHVLKSSQEKVENAIRTYVGIVPANIEKPRLG